jgi:hypothetical protein
MEATAATRIPFLTLPGEFVKGIRSNTDTRVFLLQAVVVLYAFTAAAFRLDRPSITGDPGALARLTIPAASAIFGLLLRDAYTNPDRPPHASAIDAMVAFGFAFLAEGILSALSPGLMLARLWAPTQGGFVGISLLVASRSLFPPGAQFSESGGVISLAEVRWKAEELRRRSRRCARAYFATCVLFFAISAYGLIAGNLKIRCASWIVAGGSVYLLHQSVSRISAERELHEFYRDRLQRQIVFLQHAGYWYYGSLLPGVTVLLSEIRCTHTGS